MSAIGGLLDRCRWLVGSWHVGALHAGGALACQRASYARGFRTGPHTRPPPNRGRTRLSIARVRRLECCLRSRPSRPLRSGQMPLRKEGHPGPIEMIAASFPCRSSTTRAIGGEEALLLGGPSNGPRDCAAARDLACDDPNPQGFRDRWGIDGRLVWGVVDGVSVSRIEEQGRGAVSTPSIVLRSRELQQPNHTESQQRSASRVRLRIWMDHRMVSCDARPIQSQFLVDPMD